MYCVQNISLMAKAERCVPDATGIIDSGLSMQGGICFDINTFINFLLNALGYTSHLIGGMYTATGLKNCHVAVVVKGLDSQFPFSMLTLYNM